MAYCDIEERSSQVLRPPGEVNSDLVMLGNLMWHRSAWNLLFVVFSFCCFGEVSSTSQLNMVSLHSFICSFRMGGQHWEKALLARSGSIFVSRKWTISSKAFGFGFRNVEPLKTSLEFFSWYSKSKWNSWMVARTLVVIALTNIWVWFGAVMSSWALL